MYNLIQIQDAIKGLPTDEVMKYVNGTNPNVPSYLALGELNRRKQLQDTASEFYGQPSTVKDQIAGSLTGAPQGVNPTAAPAGVNPAAVPPQLAIQQPPPTQAPAQVNPAAAPPQFAHGGLATLPVPMFKQSNYAGGGIVAFDEGGDVYSPEGVLISGPSATSGKEYGIGNLNPEYKGFDEKAWEREFGKKKPEVKASEPPKSEPNKVPENPNVQASNTSSGRLANAVAIERLSEKTAPNGQQLTDEQLFARRQALNKLAGVEADPYAGLRERYAKIEERRAAQEEKDPMDSIMARLAAFATAAPEKGFGYQMGESAKVGMALEREQAALRDKQANDMAGLQKEIIKEEDSRKRGDVKGVEEARAAQQKYQMDLADLEVKRQNAAANMAQATRPTQFESQVALAKSNPDLFRLIQGQGKAGVMTLEEAYKTVVADPMSATMTDEQKRQKAREIYNWANGQQQTQQVNPNLPPLVTKDGKTYILQSNGKYIEKT